MKIKRILADAAPILASALLLASCADTDVVGKVAKTSFGAVLAASGPRASRSADGRGWTLASPQGDLATFSDDFSRKDGPDAVFSFDAAPFLAAGLDVAKLPSATGIAYSIKDGRFLIDFDLGDAAFSAPAAQSFAADFSEIVRTSRARIGYHEKLDHYGVKLGDGTMLEWAKDMKKNDKDLVWALNPAPFIAAGVDPSKIAGWTFAKVETKDDNGKTVFVDKLLKFFDLE